MKIFWETKYFSIQASRISVYSGAKSPPTVIKVILFITEFLLFAYLTEDLLWVGFNPNICNSKQ